MTDIELTAALRRADKLIRWMSTYIGGMAPGNYAECYHDLNEHCAFMDRDFMDRLDHSDTSRMTQYQAGRQRAMTILHQLPEGLSATAWLRHPDNAPEAQDDDDFKAGYWSVTVSPFASRMTA